MALAESPAGARVDSGVSQPASKSVAVRPNPWQGPGVRLLWR